MLRDGLWSSGWVIYDDGWMRYDMLVRRVLAGILRFHIPKDL
jgi:hypothetical protein